MVCLNFNFSHKVDMGINIAWSVAPALNFHSIFSHFFRELCGKNWPTRSYWPALAGPRYPFVTSSVRLSMSSIQISNIKMLKC